MGKTVNVLWTGRLGNSRDEIGRHPLFYMPNCDNRMKRINRRINKRIDDDL